MHIPHLFAISRSVLRRMKNVSGKSYSETQNTHFIFSIFFSRKSCRLWDNVENYCTAGQSTDDNIAHIHFIMDTYGYNSTQTLSLRENRLTGSHCQITDIPAYYTTGIQELGTPHGTHVLHQIIYNYLILYTHIYCKDARDLDIIVFWFCFLFFGFFSSFRFVWFLVCCCILYSTSLSSYVQPDDGQYGRNM